MRIIILLFVIIVSLIFKYYIFQLQYFKDQLLEDFDINNNSMSDIKDPNVKNAILDFKRKKDVISYYEDIQKSSNGADKIVLSSNDKKYSNAINTSINEIKTSIDNVENSNRSIQGDLDKVNAEINVKKGTITDLNTQIATLTRKYEDTKTKIEADNKTTTELINNQGTNIYKKKENFGTIIEGATCGEVTDGNGGVVVVTDYTSNCPAPPPPPDPFKNIKVKDHIIIYYNFNEVYEEKYVQNLITKEYDLNLQINTNAMSKLDSKTRTVNVYDVSGGNSLNCKGAMDNNYGAIAAAMTNYPGGRGNIYKFGKKFTMMFWMFYDTFDITNTGIIWICNWNNPMNDSVPVRDISIRLGQDGEFANIVVNIGAFEYKHDAKLTKNVWYHIAVTLDVSDLTNIFSTKLTIYVNGVYIIHPSLSFNRFLSNSLPEDLDKINTIYIGGSSSAGRNNGSFKGYIDDFIVYDRILTDTEIISMYGGNVTNSVNNIVKDVTKSVNNIVQNVTKSVNIVQDDTTPIFKKYQSKVYLPLNKSNKTKNLAINTDYTSIILNGNKEWGGMYSDINSTFFDNDKPKSHFIAIPFPKIRSPTPPDIINGKGTYIPDFTFCFWINVADNPYYTAVSITDGGNPLIQCEFQDTNIFYIAEFKKRISLKYSNPITLINNWTHVAYTCHNDKSISYIQLYVNGSNVNGVDKKTNGERFLGINKPNWIHDFKILIGKSGDNNRAFRGYIREFYFIENMLNDGQIKDIYNKTKL